MTTLLIVEDDINTNEAISEYFKEAGYIVIPTYNGEQALQLFFDNPVDVVILDIMLPKVTGITVLNKIREKSNVPILMLTSIEDEYMQITSFDGLADDYITKPFSMVLLGKRIISLLRRSGKQETLNVWHYGDIYVDFSGYCASDCNGKIDITPKEIQLLKLLVEHKGLVLTRTQILDEIWADDVYVLDRLVDTYIKNIRKKLRLDCIITVKGVGYKIEVKP